MADGEGGSATGTGTETRKGFEDFVEKAETRSIGRALAALGIGTQFVGQDLTEGEHVADAPGAQSHEQTDAPLSPQVREGTNGDERPTMTPTDAGLPCGGLAIEALKPGQLAMLLSKTASLVHAEGDTWVPLLAALQREKARRLEPGRLVPVRSPVPTGGGPDQAPPAGPAEAPREATTPSEPPQVSGEVAARQRWGALSRRSMRAGLSPTIWESLRQAGDYQVAETMIVALETAPNWGA